MLFAIRSDPLHDYQRLLQPLAYRPPEEFYALWMVAQTHQGPCRSNANQAVQAKAKV